METIWLKVEGEREGGLAKTALVENELPLRSAVVPLLAPDPKCFPRPSILLPF